jgi:hypothetical protein
MDSNGEEWSPMQGNDVERQLADVEYLERELGRVLAETSVELEDPELAAEAQRAALAHGSAEERLKRVLAGAPRDVSAEVKQRTASLHAQLSDAHGRSDVLAALLAMERAAQAAISAALQADISPAAAHVLQQDRDAGERRVDSLERLLRPTATKPHSPR